MQGSKISAVAPADARLIQGLDHVQGYWKITQMLLRLSSSSRRVGKSARILDSCYGPRREIWPTALETDNSM